jgi:hypothetical protein
MNFKKHFASLVLIVFSIILLVMCALSNVAALQPQRDAFQQLGVSFQIRAILLALAGGLGRAALILACVWLGVGINRWLLRIKDSAKRKLAMNGIVFASLLLCVGLPALGLILTYTAFSPQHGWEQLPAPPETAELIAGGVFNRVIIETDAGNYFSHNIPNDGQGWQTDEKPDASLLPEVGASDSPSVETPRSSISMVGVPSYPGSTQKVYFAVLEDRTVWYLSATDGAFLATALLATVLLPILIGSLLILSGMGAAFLLNWLARRIYGEADEI